jgi:hypothetical protein
MRILNKELMLYKEAQAEIARAAAANAFPQGKYFSLDFCAFSSQSQILSCCRCGFALFNANPIAHAQEPRSGVWVGPWHPT